MMKNRAGLLALLVLVVATVLMVFFVMPRINGDKKSIGDAINQASDAVKNTITENGQKTGDAVKKAGEATQGAATTAINAADVTKKLTDLSGTAVTSLADLKVLFKDGKGPTEDVFTTAKTKTVTALQAIVDFTAPQGTDATTLALVNKAHDGAGKALAIIQSLPENIADAAAAIDKARAALTGEAAPQTQAAGPVTPSFDVLRVEPDGSTVIAGSAEPNSKLEIVDGDKVVTTTEVGPSGDFAAVLDNPLPPGDHELVLRATGKDGKAVTSEEVATVSVPKDDKSQLLAMVSKPGTASRIITAPSAKQGRVATDQQASAADTAANGAGGATANDSTGTKPQDNTAAASATGNGDSATAPAATTASAPEVMVNAVEIENNHIFVAGTTKPNAKVRAYADDKLIGEIVAGADGHFVVDGTMPLTVGDHKIRVDVLDGSGKVTVRTSVNFARPEGNQVTVAAQTPAASGSNGNAAATTMVPLDEGELGKLRGDAGKAFILLKDLFADGKQPNAEQLAAARSGTEIALKSLSEFRPAIDASATLKQAATDAANAAGRALTVLQALPKDPKSVGDALPKLGEMMAAVTKPENAAPAPTSVETSSNGGGPKTLQQAPLSRDTNAVIIRRGDTLWQISRRTYGAGVRYTTIYLANEDKINNPDRILPGQVFGLPKDALPNSEELHRKRLSGGHL
ncbi:LysM peptidoglycan-binding domain-containing protein [Rhizobium sp. LEGMi198b]